MTNLRAHLMLAIVAIIYGANYSIAKIIMDPGLLGANGFILLRILAAIFFFLLFFGKPIKIEKKDYGLFLLCAVTGVLANQLLFFNGLERTSPIHAALIMICTPLIVLAIIGFQGKKLSLLQWLGCLFGFGGAASIITRLGVQNSMVVDVLGDLMVFGNALSFGFFLTQAPKLISKYGAFEMMKYLFLIALAFCIPFGWNDLYQAPWSEFKLEHWASLIFVLIFTSFLAYALNAKALELVEPSLVSQYIYLQPLIAVLVAYMTGKDQLTLQTILAGLVIMLGVWLSGKTQIELKKRTD